MRSVNILCVVLAVAIIACKKVPSDPFQLHFTDNTLRIDYLHAGDANAESVAIDKLFKYPGWAGSLTHLIDTLNYGAYYYKIYDTTSNALIYSKGFDSYFKEYQSSDPAVAGQVKQFYESALVPLPRAPIVFALEKRNNAGQFSEVFRAVIDPGTAQAAEVDPEVQTYVSLNSGDPHVKADIAIIAEGYTAAEEQKFESDLRRFTEVFFKAEPCKSYRDKFNIRGVFKPSQDNGIDEPRAGIDKHTAVNATFNSMGSERYVLTEDNKSLRNIAGHVPYDALYIMVNHTRYGGGGIYNFYCVYTSDNIDSEYLMVHEFGHSFFGLADEYYTSSTAYNDFYSPEYEPAEPNITALGDPDNIKWKHLLTPGIEIPTPWPKARYDSIDNIWQSQRAEMNDHIAELQKNGAPASEVAQAKALYDERSAQRNKEVQAYLEHSGFAGQVGAFEGAGYVSKGMYRPSVNCIMFTRTNYFCPVCQDAMLGIINSYVE